jgi:hypothetical protein
MSRYSLIVKKQTKNGRFSPEFTSRAPAFEDRCKAKADGFPNLATWREPDLSRQKDSAWIGLESPSVEKYVNNRLKKKYRCPLPDLSYRLSSPQNCIKIKL